MNIIKTKNPWLIFPQPNPQAKLRLFCFPYAGGGASIFREWYKQLNSEIEICAVQLPGRENRLIEAPFNHLQPLINALSQEILPNLNQPFAFFGHSMGGLICFELARYLQQKHDLKPLHLFISGARAPHIPERKPPIHSLPQPEFIQELRRLNGTPAAVLENRELMEFLSPTLRADFAILETYIYTESAPLSCGITALGGLEDTEVTPEELAAWKQHTSGNFSMEMLPGNHFFLHSHRVQLLELLSKYIEFPD
ncbi:thioesterase II family protein [Nodularia sphaerocarpa]|uniref:thioesterase II family protein n=1 Tax=Nodularia sphaerocarpa TaxID=137816 RepID=UPI001EFA483C|nr:thioesterase II family protein [Nodularia sphaerocarpa]MDB9371991.1 thioesterase II family protein [Nodularia sphaerocarpa CS-585]MDB9376815.1 thioesterase II family protein [Nodularia sphaerocarpa CS-585A2]ULP71207.1 Linear gramicidin dehydrogenase LgrE [Nodularia sphaerocarpa UHCC 0038]